MQDPKCFSLLLYHCSVLDRLLMAKTVGQSIALYGTSSYLQLRSSLTCSNVACRPTPDASVQQLSDIIVLHACVFFHQWFDFFIYPFVLSVPCPSSIYWCQPPKWFAYFCSHWWELTQVVYYTKKQMQFSFCFWWWHISQCLNLCQIWAHPVPGNHLTKEWYACSSE